MAQEKKEEVQNLLEEKSPGENGIINIVNPPPVAEGKGAAEEKGEGEGAAKGEAKGDVEGEGTAAAKGEAKGDVEGEGTAAAKGDVEGEGTAAAKGEAAAKGDVDVEGDVEGAAEGEGEGEGAAEGEGAGAAEDLPPPPPPGLPLPPLPPPPPPGKGKGKGAAEGEGGLPLALAEGEGEGEGKGEGKGEGERDGEGDGDGDGDGEGEILSEEESSDDVEDIPEVKLLDDFYVVVDGDTTEDLMKGVNAYLQRSDGLRYYVYHGVQKHDGKYYQAVVQLPFDFGKRVWEFMNAKAFRVETDGEKVEALASDAMPYVLENLNFRASERKRKVVIKIPNDVKQGELVTYEDNGISRQFIADKDYSKGAEVTIDTEPAGVLKIALQLSHPEAGQFVLYKHTDGQVYQQTLRTVAQDAEGKLTVLFQGRPKRKKGETKHTFSMTVPAGVDGLTGYWVTADDLGNVLKVSLAVPEGGQTVEIQEPNVLARVRIPTAVASQIVVYKDNKAYHPKLITKDGQEVTFFAPGAARAEPAPLQIVPSGSPVAVTAPAIRSGEPLDATPDEEALDTTVTARLTAPRDLSQGSKVVIYLFDQTTAEYREYFFTAEKEYEKGSDFKVQFVQPEAPAE